MTVYEKLMTSVVKKSMSRQFLSKPAGKIAPEGVVRHADIPYKNRGGAELLADVYEPFGSDGEKRPVIVYVHGGGLVSGSKNTSVGFCTLFARRGYVVFSVEYRLAPGTKVYGQLDDVCAGFDFVKGLFDRYHADGSRVYLVSESAGSYLSVYAHALGKSEAFRSALGVAPSSLDFRAFCLIGGMLYTTRQDKTGIGLSRLIYGRDKAWKAMKPFADPENGEIIGSLPPCLLITSKFDMLEQYSLDYAKALEKIGADHRLLHIGDDEKLTHAFPVLHPEYPESVVAVDETVKWFEEHDPCRG